MCTRFYIERNNPLLLPIIHDAEKSILLRRFAERKNSSAGLAADSSNASAGRSAPGSEDSTGSSAAGCVSDNKSAAGNIARTTTASSLLITSGEVRPTDIVPVLAPDPQGNRAVYPMKWGYKLDGRTTLFNARTETAGVKPLFRQDWASHRCIVPASWYFEWDHATKEKYAIQPADQQVTWLCGLYHIENGLPYFVILTRQPGEELQKIHDRMPLIMPIEHIDDWIRPDTDPDKLLSFTLTGASFRKDDA